MQYIKAGKNSAQVVVRKLKHDTKETKYQQETEGNKNSSKKSAKTDKQRIK